MAAPVCVLVVDDVPIARLLVTRVVAQTCPGALILGAGTLGEARQILDQQPVTLVITDYHLPDGTGQDVLAAARIRRPTMTVMLISTDATLAQQSAAWGADAFFSKPLDLPRFQAALQLFCNEAAREQQA